ncbi:DUF6543 domain-containing protein [Pseudomonas sp. RIT-PI-S]|uniref:dermonecrotic toxin domain-containing protein n=1 Tax=Pseudomonas sp. RIT-PI-S TaxID=3035295 RepID=UPI0021D808C2|nr:DUF6543 domain-containing protein [Pseudomonas sp. RIT-PI-S]
MPEHSTNALYKDLIAARLPTWLAGASLERLQQLDALTARAEASRRALGAAALRLPRYSAYASEQLGRLLHDLGEQDVDPNVAMLYWVDPDEDNSALTCTLVQAAIRNFSEADTEPDAFGPGSGLFGRVGADGDPDPASRLGTTPWAFAKACRQADVGAGFATLLASQVPAQLPPTEHTATVTFPRLFCEADRDALASEACIARLKGTIDSIGEALLANWALAPDPTIAPLPAAAKRLQLAGFELDRVLVILADRNQGEGRPCLLYVPNDPQSPLTQFPSPDAMSAELQARLAHPAYLRFLAGCVTLDDEAAFIRAVEGPPPADFDRLFTTAMNPLKALDLSVGVLQGQWKVDRPRIATAFLPLHDLFSQRYASWARHTLANAATLAVPTARADRLAALARHEHWVALGEQLGLFVLSFIPGVGHVIAVYSMVQTLRSVFDASRAWLQGDERVARSLLLGAVENARFLLPSEHSPTDAERQDLLGRLQLVADQHGQSRLWVPDLAMLGSPEAPAGAGPLPPDGVLRVGNRAWVHLPDTYIEVAPGATPYVAEPIRSADERGHAPRLLGNGRGGWRSEDELPEQWSAAMLVRRSSAEAVDLDDLTVTQVRQWAGVDSSSLQGRALRGEPLPGTLGYLLRRRALLRDIGQAAAALRDTARQPLVHPAVVRTLTGLPGWPAQVGIELARADGAVSELQPEVIRSVRLTSGELMDGSWVEALFVQLQDVDLGPLIGRAVSVEEASQRLGRGWAEVIERQRDSLLDALSGNDGLSEPADDVAAQRAVLARQFPSLPRDVLDDLLSACDSVQLTRLNAGRVPLAIAELAAQYQRQLRIGLACEALHDGRSTADRDALLMGLLPSLEGWPPGLAIELRQGGAAGPLLRRAGPEQAAAHVIAVEHGRYRAYGLAPPTVEQGGTLEHAVISILHRQAGRLAHALSNVHSLRERLVAMAIAHQPELHRWLGMAGNTRRFFRAPTRFADGRLGYALSGRGAGSPPHSRPDTISYLLRALYPDVDLATLQTLRGEVGEGAAAVEEITRRRRELSELRVQLGDWLRGASSAPRAPSAAARPARELTVRVMLQAWQRRFICTRATLGDGPVRHSLSLAYLQIRASLPVVEVSFPHILELELVGMGLERVDPAFLAMFPNARILHLDGNRLRELPGGPSWVSRLREAHLRDLGPECAPQLLPWLQPSSGALQRLDLSNNPTLPTDQLLSWLGQFQRLQELQLDYNEIRLTVETQDAFAALAQLEMLSLDGNPLGMAPNVQSLSRLSRLSIAEARLQAIPPGLDALMAQPDLRLTYINLADNAIRQLPDLTTTEFFRRNRQAEGDRRAMDLNLDGNPLDAQAVAMLGHSGFEFDPGADGAGHQVAAEDVWLLGCPEPLQGLIRNAREEPSAQAFYQVLGEVVRTGPYLRGRTAEQRQEAVSRAWMLAELVLMPGPDALPGLTELRDRLFEMATEARATCGDGVALTLDQFEAEVSVWRAIAGSAVGDENGPLLAALTPARGLHRQALLDAQAQRLVRARVARLAGREAPDPATDLADEVPPHQLDIGIDEVELRLLLRQLLQHELELPQVSERLYASVVAPATVLRIAARVRALDTREGFAQWLVNHQQTWRLALERRYAAEFEQVREPYNEALAYVLERAAGESAGDPLGPAVLDLLEAVEPNVQWRNAAGGDVLPVLSEQQAYLLSQRLSERFNLALDALRLRLTLGLIG